MTDTDEHLLHLIEAHPLLFRGRPPALESHLPPGWYALVDKLCSDITTALGLEACASFESRQIKEKYGTLRFYFRINGHADLHIDIMSPAGHSHLVRATPAKPQDLDEVENRLRELVGAACSASEATCQTCGAPAELRNLGGYLTTLCELHFTEMRAGRAERERDTRSEHDDARDEH